MEFKITLDGLKKSVRDLEQKTSAGLQIPLGGSEDDAVQDVEDQLKSMGITPNKAEVRKMVRDTRGG